MPKSVAPPVHPAAPDPASASDSGSALNSLYSGDSASGGLGAYLAATSQKKPSAKSADSVTSHSAAKSASDKSDSGKSAQGKSAADSAASPKVQPKNRQRLESTRPSAASLLRRAGEQETKVSLVHTSLRLKPDPNRPQLGPTSGDAISAIRSAAASAIATAPKPIKIVPPLVPPKEQPSSAPVKPASAASIPVNTVKAPTSAKPAASAKSLSPAHPSAPKTVKTSFSPAKPAAQNRPTQLAATPAQPAAKPAKPPRRFSRFFQDIKRPAASAPTISIPSPSPAPAPASAPTISISTPAEQPQPTRPRPLDSLKNRFRPAPKGYASTEDQQPRPAPTSSFHNPTFATSSRRGAKMMDVKPRRTATAAPGQAFNPATAAPNQASLPTPGSAPVPGTAPSPAAPVPGVNSAAGFAPASGSAQSAHPASVHLYGLSNYPESFSPTPDWAKPYSDAQDHHDGLGIIEDYHPQTPAPADSSSARAISHSSFTSPDNNRYALSGQSPYFLKNAKSLAKRPLAAPGSKYQIPTASKSKSAPSVAPLSRKNSYEKRPAPRSSAKKSAAPSPRDVVARPTIVVPDSHRSHTPMFVLLIVTVLLGAAVGALAYLFFFQGK